MTALRIEKVSPYRRLIVRTMVEALRLVFDNEYPQEGQLKNLKVTNKFPLAKIDYPSIVVEYSDQQVLNAGVGHEEWFTDPSNILRKWHHRRAEGNITFSVYALSTLDRDLLADALIEVLSFGRLSALLLQFFHRVYGDPAVPFSVATMMNQLMLNTDLIHGNGDGASIAPWQPEDVLVYTTSYSLALHAGFYNTIITQDPWAYLGKVNVNPYPQGEVDVGWTYSPNPPYDSRPDLVWTNPFDYYDFSDAADDTVPEGVAVISGLTYLFYDLFDGTTLHPRWEILTGAVTVTGGSARLGYDIASPSQIQFAHPASFTGKTVEVEFDPAQLTATTYAGIYFDETNGVDIFGGELSWNGTLWTAYDSNFDILGTHTLTGLTHIRLARVGSQGIISWSVGGTVWTQLHSYPMPLTGTSFDVVIYGQPTVGQYLEVKRALVSAP